MQNGQERACLEAFVANLTGAQGTAGPGRGGAGGEGKGPPSAPAPRGASAPLGGSAPSGTATPGSTSPPKGATPGQSSGQPGDAPPAGPEVGTPEEWTHICVRFLRDHVERAQAMGLVVGMSGGIDSAVVAALAVRALGRERVRALIMPAADSDPRDAQDARLVCESLGVVPREVPIAGIVAGFEQALADVAAADERVRANAKARARMMVLYAEAQAGGRLVCGTGNKSELLTGYFTKHGDGGVDLQPIGDLYKTQVIELARHLGLPRRVIEKPPTAGLRPGQTDEADLGILYADLDRILKGMELNQSLEEIATRTGLAPAQVERIDRLVRRSEHKRHAPLVPKQGPRTVGIDWRRSVHWDAR